MSYYMLIDEIKEKFDYSWLTPSQKKIYDSVTEKFQDQQIIFIYGASGTGKTFLSWNLEKRLNAFRVVNLSEVEDKEIVIIDDFSNKRKDIRNLLQELFFQKISKAIVITEKKPEDDVLSLCLEFNDEDRRVFKNNLWKHFNFQFNSEKDDYNMNALIKYNIS